MSYIRIMKRVVLLLTAGALLSMVVSDGLLADSKRLQKSKITVSDTKKELPARTSVTDLADTLSNEQPTHQPQDEPRDGEEINWQVLSSGGRPATAGDFVFSGTMGQFVIGAAANGEIGVHHGYWQDFSKSYICGDADASGYVDIDDIVYILAYAFLDGPAPIPVESADADCSGYVDIDDVVYILAYAFRDGPAPCDPDNDGEPDC